MRVYVYPADMMGCGYFRLIWPARALQADHDGIQIVEPSTRWNIGVQLDQRTGMPVSAFAPSDAEVIVMQRVTHVYMATAVQMFRDHGIAVIVDIDDDLSSIHPDNPAHDAYHPRSTAGVMGQHSWQHLQRACQSATLVTCTTEKLARVYGKHGRVAVLPNYLPDIYYDLPHIDNRTIGWPAGIHSHPNDPHAVGNGLSRVLHDHRTITTRFLGQTPEVYRKAFNLPRDPEIVQPTDTLRWPQLVNQLGIGIAPLADTQFNAAKSWLKPLEMAALGVPWVASPRADYLKLSAELGAGIFAERPSEWYREISRLLADDAHRLDQSARLKAAAERFRIRNHAERWWVAWKMAYEIQRKS